MQANATLAQEAHGRQQISATWRRSARGDACIRGWVRKGCGWDSPACVPCPVGQYQDRVNPGTKLLAGPGTQRARFASATEDRERGLRGMPGGKWKPAVEADGMDALLASPVQEAIASAGNASAGTCATCEYGK